MARTGDVTVTIYLEKRIREYRELLECVNELYDLIAPWHVEEARKIRERIIELSDAIVDGVKAATEEPRTPGFN